MSQKVTLSIPDLLHEKLEEWRASFNLSKMFQEALTDAIQKKEDLQKRFSEDFDISDVVKRLRQEKRDWGKKIFKSGKREGFKWAQHAQYPDLLYVLSFKDAYKLISDSKMNSYFKKIYKNTDLVMYTGSGSVHHEQMFMKGWHNGVVELWEQVKDKL